jgi:hypothetical protein
MPTPTQRQLAEQFFLSMKNRKFKHYIQADMGIQEDMMTIAQKVLSDWVPKENVKTLKKDID